MQRFFYLFIAITLSIHICYAQNIDRKTISNCKVVFDVSVIDSTASPEVISAVSNVVKTSYVKGNKSRNDLVAPGFKQTTIFSANNDTIVVLKEVGNAKYISYVDTRTFGEKKNEYEGILFTTTRDSKKILGYECKRAQAQMPDGTYFDVYYAPAIEPSNKEFQLQFKELPGFVLQYEAYYGDQKTRVRYIATSIDLSLVPAMLFDWPKKGYKVL